MTTKEKIFTKALELFNNEGVEYVGMRELAAHLNMRVSNITYYYSTKDDLVFAISQGLKEANSKIVVENDNITLLAFLNMLKQVFHNHVQYRCLLLSFVHLMEQNKVIKSQYKKNRFEQKYGHQRKYLASYKKWVSQIQR
jgi:AcrR family transcriptional regulator